MYGRVTRTFPDKGYGFILGEDRKSYFIHHSKLDGEYINSGYYIFFKPFQNDRSVYNARNVMVIEAPERKHKHGNTRKKHGCVNITSSSPQSIDERLSIINIKQICGIF